MSVLNENTIIGASAATASGGYTIDNSLRFNDNDTPTLTRTPASAGTRTTWTFSAWVKRSNMGEQDIFGAGTASAGFLKFRSDGVLQFGDYTGGYVFQLRSSALYRDPSAWYHIIAVFDTTNGTATHRQRLYVNGLEVVYGTQTNGTGINDINNNVPQWLGHLSVSGGIQYLDGYLAEVNFIDGLALTPDSFGEFGDYGEWKPLKYTGAYGTNGFYLDFKNSGSLGNDAAGSNNWTPTNLAATDQMLDSPTNNFATLNPLAGRAGQSNVTLAEGNLVATHPNSTYAFSTMEATRGKLYWEWTISVLSGIGYIGIHSSVNGQSSNTVGRVLYRSSDGNLNIDGGSYDAYGASYTTGDIIGVALNMDSSEVTFYKNGVSQGAKTGITTTGLSIGHHSALDSNTVIRLNFGQDSSFAGNKTAQGNSDANGIGDFYYAPPTGFLALCTQNLPEPTIVPSEHFNTVLYSGTGVDARSVIGLGMQPDFTWIKERSNTSNHELFDVVRGVHKNLESNANTAEGDYSSTLQSFDSDGFTVGTSGAVNESGQTYVAWNWKANGTGVSNTDGTITSTVSANVDAGFSIVSYTGNGTSGATIGHGLSVEPEMVIFKNRDVAANWGTYTAPVGVNYTLQLDTTNAKISVSGKFSGISSTVLGVNAASDVNTTSNNYIAYAFHSVDGYSKVGSYTGNGSTDGTFVHCGFRPAYVMIKRTDSAHPWQLLDSKRSPENAVYKYLSADSSSAEGTYLFADFTSNGIKLRNSATSFNANGGTYIFLAFAESPFKHSNAR
jgi:hypothetical protein